MSDTASGQPAFGCVLAAAPAHVLCPLPRMETELRNLRWSFKNAEAGKSQSSEKKSGCAVVDAIARRHLHWPCCRLFRMSERSAYQTASASSACVSYVMLALCMARASVVWCGGWSFFAWVENGS